MEYTSCPKKCFFKETLETCNVHKKFDTKISSDIQKKKIVKCSHETEDSFYNGVLDSQSTDLYHHKDCYADYTSNVKIARYLKRKAENYSRI